jgi:hypothetical protein
MGSPQFDAPLRTSFTKRRGMVPRVIADYHLAVTPTANSTQ